MNMFLGSRCYWRKRLGEWVAACLGVPVKDPNGSTLWKQTATNRTRKTIMPPTTITIWVHLVANCSCLLLLDSNSQNNNVITYTIRHDNSTSGINSNFNVLFQTNFQQWRLQLLFTLISWMKCLYCITSTAAEITTTSRTSIAAIATLNITCTTTYICTATIHHINKRNKYTPWSTVKDSSAASTAAVVYYFLQWNASK